MSLSLSISQILGTQPRISNQKRGRKDEPTCPKCKLRLKVIAASGIKQPYCAECFRENTRNWRKKNANKIQATIC